MTAKSQTAEVTASVTMPSADLINFRFDQNDRAMEMLDAKLDKVLSQAISPKEFSEAKAEAAIVHADQEKRIRTLEDISNQQAGTIRTLKYVLGISLTVLGIVITYIASVK